MVAAWWAAGLAVPAVVIKGVLSGRGNSTPTTEEAVVTSSRVEDGTDPQFVCERVCTSDRLLRRMGGLSKDPTPNTCVTVCGASEEDACTEACQRAVCTNTHQVPAWNDACLKRCQTECLRGRASERDR
ncbi:hypothetical protein WJX72_009216 [[Myrmecia] bisecta]|uniref:Uncharacterized protein n=1 Tax=[Myrmecia] bisecta TaxID=41462 RepID=A0AAW1Q9Y4_9CHLO